MPMTEAILFECPTCGPEYKLVRVETSTVAPHSGELTCRKCGGPLRGREGPFVLKYPRRYDMVSLEIGKTAAVGRKMPRQSIVPRL